MAADRTLSGVGVAVTRGEGENGPLTAILRKRGARILNWASIAFEPPEDRCPLLASLARIQDYDWICFSSPRAVEAVVSRVQNAPEGVKVAAVGPSTASALKEAGWPVHRLPKEGRGEGLVEAFREAGDAEGRSIFFPASSRAREEIPTGLAELGADVDRTTAYRMVTLPVEGDACRAAYQEGRLGVVTFASPSAMEALRAGMGEDLFRLLADKVPAAAMGPTTAAALEEAGWRRVSVAPVPTLDGLADAAEAAIRSDPA